MKSLSEQDARTLLHATTRVIDLRVARDVPPARLARELLRMKPARARR